jgi:hypothetical protein
MHRLARSLTNQSCGPLLIWNGPLQIWNGTLFSKMAPWCGQVRGHSLFDKKFFPIPASVLHSMLNAKRFEIVYFLHHLYIMYSNIKTSPVTLRNYQPVAWVLYQRVIDQSKADIFIKPGIIWHITWTRPHYYINTHSIDHSFAINIISL